MLMRTVAIWIVERATELLAGAALTLAIFGPSDFPLGATVWDELRTALLAVGFFYVASAYVVSCVAVGLLSRRREPVMHGGAMAGLFIGHTLIFFLVIGSGNSFPILLVVVGTVVVFLVNAAGAEVLKRTRREPER
jgi:hypothetical protein